MIKVYRDTKIFIACPANHATGGTELLHQLSFKLNKFGFQTAIYYLPNDHPNPSHPNFLVYAPKFVREIEDSATNILIMPEIYIDLFRSRKFLKVRKVIWWLSVDDYVRRLDEMVRSKAKKPFFKIKCYIGRYQFPDIGYFRNASIEHIVQSSYAQEYLLRNGIKVTGFLSDYLNRKFLERDHIAENKKNYVLYNPLKGYEFTQRLMLTAPELQWIPLQNMTPSEVADILGKSKVYIDFGHHPGKDRFPREAAISGCCVITGRRGSANFFEDVAIPDEFKFDEFSVNPILIIQKIRDCLGNYSHESQKLESYKKRIQAEELQFEKDLLTLFQRV